MTGTTLSNWKGYTCETASSYCNNEWDKDTRRCCPLTCGSRAPFDNVACEASTDSGTCTYPNGAQCPSSGK